MELRGEVSGERRADPSAEHQHPAPDVADDLDRLVEVPMRQHVHSRLQVLGGHVQRVAQHRVGLAGGLIVSVPGEGRAEPRLHLVAQRLLELRVAAKPELGDEPRHRRRADVGALGEPGDALQAGDRVGGQEDPGELAFGRAQAVEALSHQLADPGFGTCDVYYILAH